MSYHIKRDGAWLCGLDKKSSFLAKKDTSISFSAAHKSELNYCCDLCKQKYVDALNKMPNPPQPVKGSFYYKLAVITLK